MRKYIIITLSFLCFNVYAFNVYANDIESELGPDNPYVNTKTMQAARYFCHAFFGLATKVSEIESEKIEHMAQKIAKLSSHCAKGNFHQALTDSGLADAVHLQPSHLFSGAHHIAEFNVIKPKLIGGPGTTTPIPPKPLQKRLFNHWEHRAIVLHHMGNR